jgi:hypothetical protein
MSLLFYGLEIQGNKVTPSKIKKILPLCDVIGKFCCEMQGNKVKTSKIKKLLQLCDVIGICGLEIQGLLP